MVRSHLFLALAILLGVLQVCTCNPIAPGEEQDVTKIFTADELQRARSVGIKDRELLNGKSRGVSVDEMVKLSVLQKTEVSRIVDFNDTTPLTITFEETPQLCEIFVPEHKTAAKHTSAQGDRLNELFGALDDFPRNIQFLFLRNSICAYASEPSKLDKSADTFGSKFLPFMRFRFWILKSKNSTSVERVGAVKQVCCAYNGQYNKEVTEMKVASTTFTLSNEQITNYDKLWNEFEATNTSQSFDQVCNFLRTTKPSDKC
ncbi:uncharacterized protein LOC119085933 [Bradysia coprophila]|uniref:uncharacterized protein LOC119085933 n=1 Tax=Bradysia coprophila TaxID=38358 RepID=UPI00187D8402|nr:uncharacterized protein LOC119085933 [Bradysia coprophila]XP_037052380.1 uncharacterized protein LOC119085933 [Bradysia coprophila]